MNNNYDEERYDRREMTDEELSEAREEFRDRRPTLRSCSDRMCGAMDCPNCRGADAYAYVKEQEEESE